MPQPGRKYSAGTGYRYGFNGKENDDEVKEIEGSQQDYGMRIYDPRVGRFLSVDPLSTFYPWYTSYQFAGNTPIMAIDVDGEEPKWMIDENGRFTKPMITLLTAGLKYRESRMIHVKWRHFNTTKFGQTLFARIRYNPRITESQITDMEEYLSLWFNLAAHEGRHRNEYPLSIWLAWGASYGITDFIPEWFGRPYEKGLWESRAYSMKRTEGRILNLVNHDNGLILKTLELDSKEYSDEVKSNIIIYAVASYNYEEALEKNNSRKGLWKWIGNLKVAALKKQMERAKGNVDQKVLDKLNSQEKRSIRMPEDGGKNPDGSTRPDRYKTIKEQIKKEKDD